MQKHALRAKPCEEGAVGLYSPSRESSVRALMDDSAAEALENLRTASALVRELRESGVTHGVALEDALNRELLAKMQVEKVTSKRGRLDIVALISGLTKDSKRQARIETPVVNTGEEKTFAVLNEHFVLSALASGLEPTGPPIMASFDLSKTFVEAYGFLQARKIPAVVSEQIREYVRVGSLNGYLSISELVHVIGTTMAVAVVKAVLIDGQAADYKMPRKSVWPTTIDIMDVRISDDK